MKAVRVFLAFPFILCALVGVSVTLAGVLVMTTFGALATWVEGVK